MWKTNTKISNCLASKQQFCWWANWSYLNKEQSGSKHCPDMWQWKENFKKQNNTAMLSNKVLGCLNVLVKFLLQVLFSMFGCVASVKKRLSYLCFEWCAIITTFHCFHREKRGEDWCSVTKWLYGQLKWKSCYLPCKTYWVMINKKRVEYRACQPTFFPLGNFFLFFFSFLSLF